ncbi:MAG TPA: GGDEF domain-containing protein [Rubrivivax sp.]|nr:GGDEF domain-containing protein [Rubrivivax sp.]
MSRLVEQIAELTAFRDRDALDFSLATALQDLLRPQAVLVHRLVGEPGAQHWLLRARVGGDEDEPAADSLWAELDSLPALQAMPHHAHCLQGGRIVALEGADGTPALTLFALAAEHEALGVLELRSERPLAADAQRLVCAVLRIYRNFQGLLDYSERDTLTGLLNRKTFDECFARAVRHPRADPGRAVAPEPRRVVRDTRACLGLVDVDHFKRVNDSLGHLIGDEVLLLLSRLMRSTFRYHDRLFRFGGEEFVVLMRCGSVADARSALERLREAVERHVFPRIGHITISVGLTLLRPDDTPSAAFERADKAVYFAKHNGRNQLCDHDALVAGGLLADETRASDVELF